MSGRYELKETRFRRYVGPVIETSAAVNRNQDGGVLLDSRGRVLGMITLNYDDSKFTGVAIPINRMKRDIRRIMGKPPAEVEKKSDVPGWLGLSVREAENGLEVRRVSSRGPARKAGIRVGDILTRIGGRKTLRRDRFREIEEGSRPGSTVWVHLLRDGKTMYLPLKVGEKRIY